MVVLVVCGRARLAVVLLLVVRISGQALDTCSSFTCEFLSNSKRQYGANYNVKLHKRLRGDNNRTDEGKKQQNFGGASRAASRGCGGLD